VTYNGSSQAASVIGSVAGVVSNIKYDGSVTEPTNAGTYAVTADFMPDDTVHYNSLTAASADNFVINPANQTITFDPLSDKLPSDPDFDVSATASSGLTVSFTSLTTGVCTVSAATVHLVSTGTCTIRASQAGNGNYNAATPVDQSFAVYQPATKFVILPPTSGTIDSPVTVTVQAQKPDNSVDTNYQNDVTLHVTGSAFGDGLVDIVDGVGLIDISDTVAETVTLSLEDTETTSLDVSSTQQLVFASGGTSQFTISDAVSLTAGERVAYTVTRKDQYGNLRTTGSNTVYLYSSSTSSHKKFYDAATDGAVITSIAIQDGQSSVNVWYYDGLVGAWTITASDHTPAPDGNTGINDAIDSIQVVAGPVARFILDNPGDMTSGTRLGYTISREDSFANVITSGDTTVYLYSNSTGTSTPLFYAASTGDPSITSVVIPDGQSSVGVWYYDENPDTWIVTVSDNATAPDAEAGVIDDTDTVVVSPAPIVATRFVIAQPVNGTVDAPISITVQAEDLDGNVDTTYQNNVTLNASGSATGYGLIDIVNGVGTIAISDMVAQTVNLSLTDSEGTGLVTSSTRSVVFAPGVVTQFALDNPGDVAAGARIGYTVTRKDQYGNLVVAGATDVYLYSSSNGLYKKFYDAASGGSSITHITISNGQSSAAFWQYDEKAGDWFITVSDNATAPDAVGIADATDDLTIQPAAVDKFLINDPGDMTAGTRLGYTLTREDQFGNLVTSSVTLVYLYSSSTGTTDKFYDVASGGAPIIVATINDGVSTSDFWYYDESPGNWVVTASDSSVAPNGATGVDDATDSVTVSSVPIVATHFVILPVSSVQINTPTTVTIQAQDASGNIDTTYQQDVSLVLSGSATGGGLVNIVNGVGEMTITDATAETVTLSLSDTEITSLNVSSTQSMAFSETPVAPVSTGSGAGALPVQAPLKKVGVYISGRAFPGAQIDILAVSGANENITARTIATANGSFDAFLTGVAAGSGAYGLVAIDPSNRTTQTKVLNANYGGTNSVLTLNASLFSPTLGLVNQTVRKGDVVGFVGMATPGYTVGAQVDGKTVASTLVAGDGSYKILFPTGTLAIGSHTARVRQVSPGGVYSEYAPQKVFTVTTLFTPQTDFNQDGVINVQDWSIFLSRWSSLNKATHLLDDLNGDGKVDVSDLSIFVRTLKK
jgi:hypothetical protein